MVSVHLDLQLSSLFDDVHTYLYKEIFPKTGWADAYSAVDAIKQLNAQTPHGSLLPLLTCGIVGGDIYQAIPLAAAWVLYDIASDVFDDIQDGDGKERPWNSWAASRAMNVGVQLLGGAQQCLGCLRGINGAQQEIIEQCGRVLKQAARDQNLVAPTPFGQHGLENYLRQLLTKSGEIFACIARSGTRLHTDDPRSLTAIYSYGQSLGIMIQLVDDCRDLSPAIVKSDLENGHYTLPVLYGLSQTAHPLHGQLTDLLASSTVLSDTDAERVCDILTEMEGLNHAFYLIHGYQAKAIDALQKFPQGDYRELLEQYVTSFDFLSPTTFALAAH